MQRNTLGLAHAFLQRYVCPGDTCIDATAGRGRDTAFLCRLTGETGRVLAFDIQEEAVRQTRALLEQEGLSAEVYLDSDPGDDALKEAVEHCGAYTVTSID